MRVNLPFIPPSFSTRRVLRKVDDMRFLLKLDAGCAMVRGLVVTGLLALFVPTVVWGNPTLSILTPSGGQRGTEVKVTFRGDRFKDAQEIVFFEPSIKAKSLTVVPEKGDKIIEAVIEIPADARLGTYPCMVRTPTGLSQLQTFQVTAFPYVEEKEKNNNFEEGQKVDLNVTVAGKVTNEDLDYYAVDLKAGQRFTAEVEAMRLGLEFFDPHLGLYDSQKQLVVACDDHPLTYQDSYINLKVPADGTYYLVVRDSAFGGADNFQYLLHIGDFPRPTGSKPSGGPLPTAEKPVELTMIGDVMGEFNVTLNSAQMPTFRDGNKLPFYPTQEGKLAPSPNWYFVSDRENVIEAEPNGKHEEAQRLNINQAVTGLINEPGDVDVYVYNLEKGKQYEANVYANRIRSRLDAIVSLRNMQGGTMKENDDQGGLDPYIRFDVPENGEYQLFVYTRLKRGGVDYPYRLEVTEVKPVLEMSTIDFDRYVTATMSVAPGGCNAVIVNATRKDFGGALKFMAEGLPPGVKMIVPDTWTARGQIPVMFEAEETAPMGVGLTKVNAVNTREDGSVVVDADLVQSHLMIRQGGNNDAYWVETSKVMPVAVTQKYPFKIKAVAPKVPMVQNGAMQLKVEVEREAGFEGEIALSLLLAPNGLNANQVTIKGNETSGALSLNTNDKAETGKFAVCVRAKTTVNGSPVALCTPFVDLEVTDPYLNLEFEQATVEQGKTTPMIVKVKNKKEYEGNATLELQGLPAKAVAENKEAAKDTAEVVFDVKAETDTPVGQHKNLFCKVLVMQNGEPIEHRLYGGKLRVDEPSKVVMPEPKKEEQPAPAAEVAKAPEPPVKKPLSRIEQLRLLGQQQAGEGGK